jgi:hypothetical protein
VPYWSNMQTLIDLFSASVSVIRAFSGKVDTGFPKRKRDHE